MASAMEEPAMRHVRYTSRPRLAEAVDPKIVLPPEQQLLYQLVNLVRQVLGKDPIYYIQ